MDRRPAIAAIAALGVIALGLVLAPVTRQIGTPPESPWAEGADLFWGVHVAAGALAIATAIGLARGAIGHLAVGLAIAAIVTTSSISLWLVAALGLDPDVAAYTFASAAVLVATAVVTARGLRAGGWRRWFHLLLAYAIAATPYGCGRLMMAFNVYPRGLVFVCAEAVLLFASVVGIYGVASMKSSS